MTPLSCPPPQGGSQFAQDGAQFAQDGSRFAQSGSGPARADGAPATASAARTAALIGVSALAGLFLAACGGDSSGPPPPPPPPVSSTEVPTSAAQTSASLEAFAIAQPSSDTTEPLLLDNVPAFPTSEAQDPIAIP